LLEPILSRMVQESKFITLTVTPELQIFTKEKVKELEKTFPLYRFAVLVDSSLEENGCIIESSHAIVDLQVKQQLDAMVEVLSEMMVS
uniref:FliH/SctL family protein n=1 Tax=Jeotgalibaca porci TaxID=1868793 RepID=UPI0035A16E6D